MYISLEIESPLIGFPASRLPWLSVAGYVFDIIPPAAFCCLYTLRACTLPTEIKKQFIPSLNLIHILIVESGMHMLHISRQIP